jgi:RNA polymerase sigma-B factor
MSVVSSKRTRPDREQLVEQHLPLVRSVARRYASSGEPLEDLVQVGAVGLVKAGNRFDERRGVAFAAFAAPVIEGEIRRHLRDWSSPVRIPRALQRTSGALRRKRDQLAAASGYSPSTGELAAALNLDEESVQDALRAELARTAFPLPGEEQSRGEGSDEPGDSADRLSLARCMHVLDERERKIVFLRFHADLTERQIGDELGISQAQVSRLLGAALERLRSELAHADSGGGVSDSSSQRPISEGAGADTTPNRSRKSARNASNGREGALKIGAVPTSQAAHTVEDYLELPYSIAVHAERAADESHWTATVEELPGCAAQGRSADEAVELLRGAMASWLQAALDQGREIPVPGQSPKQKTSATHSGRFLVRMPATLHTELAQAAEREHLSLNRFITKVLAASVSPAMIERRGAAERGPDAPPARASSSSQRRSRAFRIALAANITVIVLAAGAAGVLFVLALQHGL